MARALSLSRRSFGRLLYRCGIPVLDEQTGAPSSPPPPPAASTEPASLRRRYPFRATPSHLLFSASFSLRCYSSSPVAGEYTAVVGADGVATVLPDASVVEAAELPLAVPEVVAAASDEPFALVAALQMLIEGVHSSTGLNWWACIVLATLMIRVATVPLSISALKASIKLAQIRPELEKLTNEINNARDFQSHREMQKKVKDLFAKHRVTPLSPLKGHAVQVPIFLSFYFAVLNMVEKVPSFKDGGALWFTDLTTPDSLYIFPVLTSLTMLGTIELGGLEGMEGNPMATSMKKYSRGFALLMLPMTLGFPKAVLCYWVTNNLFSLGFGLAMKHPSVLRYLDIPDPATLQAVAPLPNNPFAFPGTARQERPTSPLESQFAQENSEDSNQAMRKKTATAALLSTHRLRALERAVKSKRKNSGSAISLRAPLRRALERATKSHSNR